MVVLETMLIRSNRRASVLRISQPRAEAVYRSAVQK
jgi:hypothetical protein